MTKKVVREILVSNQEKMMNPVEYTNNLFKK